MSHQDPIKAWLDKHTPLEQCLWKTLSNFQMANAAVLWLRTLSSLVVLKQLSKISLPLRGKLLSMRIV